MKPALSFLLCLSLFCSLSAQEKHNPSFEEIISLQSVSNPQISPDGQHVIFSRSSVDWKENRYDSELWLSKNGEEPFQLSNHPTQSSYGAQWSPDGQWIAFLTSVEDKTQIHVMRTAGGAAFQASHAKGSVSGYEWSPDGKQIAFLQSEDKEKEEKKRKDKYGAFAVEDEEYSMRELWLMDFAPERLNQMLTPAQMEDSALKESLKPRPLFDSLDFTINNFRWSPDGSKIAFTHQPNPLINSFLEADISVYDLETDQHRVLVSNQGRDGFADWSPDGKSILYGTDLDDQTSNFYKNSKVYRIDIDGSNNKQLAAKFDENLNSLSWNPAGIFATDRKSVV